MNAGPSASQWNFPVGTWGKDANVAETSEFAFNTGLPEAAELCAF